MAAFNPPYDEQAAIDELCARLTDICQDYESLTIFCALAELLTITCAQATNMEGLDEFLRLFATRVRSIWLEKAPTPKGVQ